MGMVETRSWSRRTVAVLKRLRALAAFRKWLRGWLLGPEFERELAKELRRAYIRGAVETRDQFFGRSKEN